MSLPRCTAVSQPLTSSLPSAQLRHHKPCLFGDALQSHKNPVACLFDGALLFNKTSRFGDVLQSRNPAHFGDALWDRRRGGSIHLDE